MWFMRVVTLTQKSEILEFRTRSKQSSAQLPVGPETASVKMNKMRIIEKLGKTWKLPNTA